MINFAKFGQLNTYNIEIGYFNRHVKSKFPIFSKLYSYLKNGQFFFFENITTFVQDLCMCVVKM